MLVAEFKSLSDLPVGESEKNVAKYWNEIDLLQKSIDTREGKKPFIFYEGPPTANGTPGIHHVMANS